MQIEKEGFRILRITEYLPTRVDGDIAITILAINPNSKSFITDFNVTQEFLRDTSLEVKYQTYWDIIMSNYEKISKHPATHIGKIED
jgi:hypothetical protein